MKIKLLVFLVATILFVASCCKDPKYHDIPDADTLFFKINDTLIYKSNLDSIQKFYVDDYKSLYFSDEEPDYFHCEPPNYYQTKMVFFRLNIDTLKNYYQINQSVNSTEISYFDDFFYSGFEKTNIAKLILNGIEIYLYEDATVYNDYDMKKIWFSPKEGIIKYGYQSGEIFTLQN